MDLRGFSRILVFSFSLDQACQQMFKTESNGAQIIDFIEAKILYLNNFWCWIGGVESLVKP